jgi:glc operon protein GlcG
MHATPTLSYTDALRVLNAIRQKLEDQHKGAAIAVVDAHGELVAFLRTDGCPLPSIQNAINKAFTAARERKPSGAIGQASRNDGFPMTNFGDLRYSGWGGGVPLSWKGVVVGAVGVSGLPQVEDAELAAFGAQALGDGA